MLTKDRVLFTIKEQLPDEFTIDALFERMNFLQNVEEGLNDSEQGRTITETELDKEFEKWFK